jgi:predicted AlkP superfamily phosphohydrolase/phosphomutase
MSDRRRVLVIGLDAACLTQLRPLIDAGDVPTLARLVEEGVTTDLESTTPPWTPTAWPSAMTGQSPWSHGVYGFHHYTSDGDARFVSARELHAPFVWEYLSALDRASIAVNMPVTHPIHEMAGSLVPGYLAEEDDGCLIDGERAPLSTLADDYRIYPRETDSREARLREYERLVDLRVEAARHLAEIHDWSLLVCQFQSTDAVFHALGDDEAVARVYRRVDDAVEALLDVAGDRADVLVVSDHGMHRYEGSFHCNAWLHDRNHVVTSTDAERRTWNERTAAEMVNDDGDGDGADRGPVAGGVRAVIETAARVGVTPQRVERGLTRLGLDRAVSRLVPDSLLVDAVELGEHVDWERSAAYCRSSAALGVRCNVAGRDPGGVIPADEFDAFRTNLIEALREVDTPDGDPLFESVVDRHAVHGSDLPNDHSAPDILVRPAGMRWEVSDVVRERTFDPTPEYNHADEGLLIARGPHVDATVDPKSPSLVDVAPTVLRLLGVEPPLSLDGAAIPPATTATEPQASPAVNGRRYLNGEGHDDGVSERVTGQLREMGYIE